MEQEFKVFSMMADTSIFTGTKSECEDYIRNNRSVDDSMYLVVAQK